MAARCRMRVVQNPTNIVLERQVGQDGSLPVDGPWEGVAEFPNLQALKEHLEAWSDEFKQGMGRLGILQYLSEAQGNVVDLPNKMASTVFDTDVGQFGVRTIKGA